MEEPVSYATVIFNTIRLQAQNGYREMEGTLLLKKYFKKIIYGHKYDSEAFIRYLNGKGADIAEDVYFVAPPQNVD